MRPGVARVAGHGHVGTGVDDDREVDPTVAVVVVLAPARADVSVGLRHGLGRHADGAAATNTERRSDRVGGATGAVVDAAVVAAVLPGTVGHIRAVDVDLDEELPERRLVVE